MIPRKLKTCKTCKKECYIWAHGNCKQCASKGYAKTTAKNKAANYKPTGELKVFQQIWEATLPEDRRCFVTGIVIKNFDIKCFAHVLPKKSYGHFRLYPENIQLMLWAAHLLYDTGTQAQRESFGYPEGWQRLYTLREELIKEYKELYGE